MAVGVKPPNAGKGRVKGVPNRITADLKAMILGALDKAGGIEYLYEQADKNPNAFLTLVGKVLPLQVNGPGEQGEHLHAIGVSLKDAPDEVVAYLAKQR